MALRIPLVVDIRGATGQIAPVDDLDIPRAINLPAAGNVLVSNANPLHTLTLTAAGARGTVTSPAGDVNKDPEQRELATNKVNIIYMAFDQTTAENAFWCIPMPDNWDGGTVTFQPLWTAASGTGGVTWKMRARSLADAEALDQAMGSYVSVSDTLIAADNVHVAPASAALTIGGTPAAGEFVVFEIQRDTPDVGDTLTADAQLLGIRLKYGSSKYGV